MAKIQENNQLFENIIERAKAIDPVNVRKWFEDLVMEEFDGGVLRIGCPDTATAQYLQDRCLAPFTLAAQNITGHLVSVQFCAHDAGSAAIPATVQNEVKLHPDYTFDSFVVGPCNRLAHASCVAVSQNPGAIYNPLFLYGNSGLGKTHLLHAICHDGLKTTPGLAVQFLSCEAFVNGFISAIEKGQLSEFQNLYRSVDVLIIDDVQFLREREQSQEEFFHTFNALYNNRRQIILTADCAPTELQALEDRLISRFKWGLVARLDAPSYETRIAIVKKKAGLRGLELPDGIAELIAEHVKNNIRELEGALTVICATARAAGSTITLDVARQALGFQENLSAKTLSMGDIIAAVAEAFDTRITDLQSKKRSQSIALPRQVCMYLGRMLTRHSLEEIGGHLGGRDHSTVLHACSKVEQMYKTEPEFRSRLDTLTGRLTKGN